MPTSNQPLILLICVGLGCLYVLRVVIKGMRQQFREREHQMTWAQGRAVVLRTRSERADAAEGPASHYAYARLRTADGREEEGWAQDDHGRVVRQWVGHEVPAWYDPADPRRFRLSPPESRSSVVLGAVIMIIITLAVVAVFALVYLLES